MSWLTDINIEIVTPRPGDKMGWVYFIACRETGLCKIGFTRGRVEKRLKALQTGSAADLMICAMQPGPSELEKRLHARLASQCVRGEWFEMSGELFAYICANIWTLARYCVREDVEPEPWLISGLRMMHEEIGELPADLANLIGEAAE